MATVQAIVGNPGSPPARKKAMPAAQLSMFPSASERRKEAIAKRMARAKYLRRKLITGKATKPEVTEFGKVADEFFDRASVKEALDAAKSSPQYGPTREHYQPVPSTGKPARVRKKNEARKTMTPAQKAKLRAAAKARAAKKQPAKKRAAAKRPAAKRSAKRSSKKRAAPKKVWPKIDNAVQKPGGKRKHIVKGHYRAAYEVPDRYSKKGNLIKGHKVPAAYVPQHTRNPGLPEAVTTGLKVAGSAAVSAVGVVAVGKLAEKYPQHKKALAAGAMGLAIVGGTVIAAKGSPAMGSAFGATMAAGAANMVADEFT